MKQTDSTVSESRPFCLTICPICTDPALEAVAEQDVQKFHCCVCGSFDIAPDALTAIRGMSVARRKQWLETAQQQTRSPVPLVEAANAPAKLRLTTH